MVLNYDDAESRQLVENCYRTTSTLINPIINWTDANVWEYLHHYGCESNPLYQCGNKRVGCIGCPLSGFKQMKHDLAKYPKYRQAYVRAFDSMLEKRKSEGIDDTTGMWKDGESVMRWWVGDNPMQVTIDDWLKIKEEQDDIMREYVW